MAIDGRPGTGRPIETLLLATDLTPASAGATDEAFQLASRLGVALVAVSVIEPAQFGGVGRPGRRLDQVRSERERAAAVLVERGRREGVEVSFLIWQGDPGESVVAAAEAESADLIVIGSHGRSGVGRMVMGSVSDHVVRHAGCPVLVVRFGARPGASQPEVPGSAA